MFEAEYPSLCRAAPSPPKIRGENVSEAPSLILFLTPGGVPGMLADQDLRKLTFSRTNSSKYRE